MVAEVLRSTGDSIAVETTIGASLTAGHFTPRGEGSFFGRMRDAAQRGTSRFAIEVTSEALAAGWAKKWRFDLGVFTNLTQDHLDAHGSFEHYLASKAQLFVHLGPGRIAVLNAADPTSMLLDRVIPPDVQRVWYASPRRGPIVTKAHLCIDTLTLSLDGTRATLAPSPFAEQLGGTLETGLLGAVFAENALAAACVGLSLQLDPVKVRQAIAGLTRVPGRFEVVAREPAVIVDYAHTPDALERTCDAARTLAESLGNSRVIVVFGAGGNRDPKKREPMGEAVGARADVALVTSDNPRREDPQIIAAAVVAGCQRAGRAAIVAEPDRARAIDRAITMAHPRDVIVVCGKGHETGQEIGDEKLPFDDAEVVRRMLGQA
jgi:UDP-N-acetylmuramoyl-L-alanyl-D-glutamate--2,6-diaminopimelate ligase